MQELVLISRLQNAKKCSHWEFIHIMVVGSSKSGLNIQENAWYPEIFYTSFHRIMSQTKNILWAEVCRLRSQEYLKYLTGCQSLFNKLAQHTKPWAGCAITAEEHIRGFTPVRKKEESDAMTSTASHKLGRLKSGNTPGYFFPWTVQFW